MDIQTIEKRSLAPAKWANLFMAFAGITAATLSNASALMLDGLFSGVNFLAAVFAARVAVSVQRKPDIMRPFGYEINEPMYVMFRSLVLTGIVTLAFFSAVYKIVQYVSGVNSPPIQLGWIAGYILLMLVICFSLAAWHHVNWHRTEKQSDLLKTERTAALVDGILSSAAGLAFFGISMLKNTPLGFVVPISDSLVVVALSLFMIPKPIRMFFNAAGEVSGNSADPGIVDQLKSAVDRVLEHEPFTFLELLAVKTGRTFFAVAYIRPESSKTVQDLDRIRGSVQLTCEEVMPVVKTEIIYTSDKPFD